VLLQSLWGFAGDLQQAIQRASTGGFHGLEANIRHPALAALVPQAVVEALATQVMPLVLELVTGGDYVPRLALGPEDHLHELERLLALGPPYAPLKVTVITGCDAWSWPQQEWFWSRAVPLAEASGLAVSFETHRSRSLHNPWTIQRFLEAFPGLRLTADLSHWCVVAERLMTPDLAPVAAMAGRVDHIHARVGHPQGPSVGHPFAPEWAEALEAHRRCWRLFRRSRADDASPFTITPEFGPDGYLPERPFSREPVADLLEINTAMARWIQAGALDAEARNQP
jgi:sugar phosphate isomerase/epimerase